MCAGVPRYPDGDQSIEYLWDPRGLGDVTRQQNTFWTVVSLPQDVGCGAALSAVLLKIARSVASIKNPMIETSGLLQALQSTQ
jgi:hypothetical protein